MEDIQRLLLPSFTSEGIPTANFVGRGPAQAGSHVMLPPKAMSSAEKQWMLAQDWLSISCIRQASRCIGALTA